MSSLRGPLPAPLPQSRGEGAPRSQISIQAPLVHLPPARPCWAEVSAGALRHNYETLRHRAAGFGARLICVVKANAYGHGLFGCARVLAEAGANWFAVTSVDEGTELVRRARQEGLLLDLGGDDPLRGRVLTLSGVFDLEDAQRAVRYGLTPVALALRHVEWLAEVARVEASPVEKYAIHLEIDTGMGRNGVRWDDRAQLEAIAELVGPGSPLRVEAVLTHFASPDDPSSPQTGQQMQRFRRALARLYALGVRPPLLHAGNSVTLFDASQTDALVELAHMYGAKLLVRPGLALYGYRGATGEGDPLRMALTWKTRITGLRRLEAGEAVSYGATFHAKRATEVATLAAGYADGYNRLLSNKGSVLIRGRRAPVLGRVTMDQIMVDVTGIENAEIGEEAVLLGTQGELTVSATRIASLTGGIPWEVLCAIGARVARVMTD